MACGSVQASAVGPPGPDGTLVLHEEALMLSNLLLLLLLGLLLSGCGNVPPAPLLTVPAAVEAIMTAAYGDRWRTTVQHLAHEVAQRTGQPFAPCTVVRRLV